MAGRRGLEILNRRKQLLIAESDLNRLALRVEHENLRAATAYFDGAVRGFGPWLVPAAAVAGLLAANVLRKRSGTLSKVASLLRWTSPALALWRHISGRGRENTET